MSSAQLTLRSSTSSAHLTLRYHAPTHAAPATVRA